MFPFILIVPWPITALHPVGGLTLHLTQQRGTRWLLKKQTRLVSKCICLYNFSRNGSKVGDFRLHAKFHTMTLALTNVLNNSFISMLLFSSIFSVLSLCHVALLADAVCILDLIYVKNQLKIATQSLDIKMNLQRNLLSKSQSKFKSLEVWIKLL